jgi:V/A-type H+-transporting ATPase subunit I
MSWRDAFEPIRMDRVAVVAPRDQLRRVLVAVAEAGVVQVELIGEQGGGPATDALRRTHQKIGLLPSTEPVPAAPCLAPDPPDLVVIERAGRLGELAGEAELERVVAGSSHHGAVAALVGWSPKAAVDPLAGRLALLGGAVVRLSIPRGAEPPTLIEAKGATGAFQPLVDTYTTVPYADLNPAALAGLAYVVMFGMMFGDVGHGALLVAAGLVLAAGHPSSLARFRRLTPFVIGAGVASTLFGLAFGEMFGPTHVVGALWLSPLDHPTTLLAVGIAAGAGLLAVSYALGTVNRWREGGPVRALVATSGLAGAALYLGIAVVGLGWYRHSSVVVTLGAALVVAGLGFGFFGCYAEAGGRGTGVAQAGVEMFDAVLRIGTNTVSFARLAAFGLTHAALGGIVWSGTTGLWHRGPALRLLAAAVFVAGNAVAFALEGLVAGVQALRLEYYELFSRIFTAEGRQFRPWHVPTLSMKETPCSPG